MSSTPVLASTPSPTVIATCDKLRRVLADVPRPMGFVPTMGALHAGHVSLVTVSRDECATTVVSIFVNPAQFAAHEDLARYPRDLASDLARLADQGVAWVFAPAEEEMYPSGHSTFVEPGPIATAWEGVHRPGHFRGVATIVLKLLNLVQPNRAYFGQKDYQQFLVIRRMVEDLNLSVDLRMCPTVREPDGLAMSSRNIYLTSDERRRAAAIYQSLRLAADLAAAGHRKAASITDRMREVLTANKLQIDYVALADPDTLAPVNHVEHRTLAAVAVRVGNTRLIDNHLISP